MTSSRQTCRSLWTESSEGVQGIYGPITGPIFSGPSLSALVGSCLAGDLRVRRFVPESRDSLVSSESDSAALAPLLVPSASIWPIFPMRTEMRPRRRDAPRVQEPFAGKGRARSLKATSIRRHHAVLSAPLSQAVRWGLARTQSSRALTAPTFRWAFRSHLHLRRSRRLQRDHPRLRCPPPQASFSPRGGRFRWRHRSGSLRDSLRPPTTASQ